MTFKSTVLAVSFLVASAAHAETLTDALNNLTNAASTFSSNVNARVAAEDSTITAQKSQIDAQNATITQLNGYISATLIAWEAATGQAVTAEALASGIGSYFAQAIDTLNAINTSSITNGQAALDNSITGKEEAAEAKRIADEAAAAAEAKRIADEEAAAAEAKRIADEEAAAAEAKRIADEAAAAEAAAKEASDTTGGESAPTGDITDGETPSAE